MATRRNIIAESSVTRADDGFTAVTVAHVNDVGGVGGARLYNALTAPNVPRYGEPHPVIPGCYCTRIVATPASDTSTTAFRVVCTYTEVDPETLAAGQGTKYGAATIEVIANTQDEETRTDRNGNYISVKYAGRVWTWVAGALIASGYTNILYEPTATVSRPTLGIRLTRRERITEAERKQIAIGYTGAVNGSTWSGFAPETWLINSVNSKEIEPGEYDVIYEMFYRPGGWQFLFESKSAGLVNPDVTDGNGRAYFDIYPTVDFSIIGLEWA